MRKNITSEVEKLIKDAMATGLTKSTILQRVNQYINGLEQVSHQRKHS
ncbi:hypothetical protein ACQKEY_22480 [Lysinibacillus fusiformis]|nr:hypothetical protein [Lysinibacillus fusiformis]